MSSQEIQRKLSACKTEEEVLDATKKVLAEICAGLEERTKRSEELLRNFKNQRA